MIDKETIKKARQADLANYLMSVGVPLVRNGSRFRHKEYDSLIFTKNAYYWNSQQEHGNAIDYLTKYMNMSFETAVSELVKFSPDVEPANNCNTDFKLNPEELFFNQEKVKKYLNETRFISSSILNYLIDNKLLYQEKKTNNICFIIYDENNKCVGTELHGIVLDKRFKGVKANSKYGYGFNVRLSDNDSYDFALFFESAIDLISFIDLKQNYEKKELNKCLLISMCGLKLNIIKQSLKAFNLENTKIVLCVDNDKAGQNFRQKINDEKISYANLFPNEKYKDWNEQLAGQQKKRGVPV